MLELAVLEPNVLPLFLCSLFHGFIAALCDEHAGTLHSRVCIRF